MPRLKKSEENTDAEVVKRVVRPRTPRASSTGEVPVKRTSRPKRIMTEEVVAEPVRKAPTPLAAETRQRKRSGRSLVAAMVLCVVMFAAGVGIGFSDKGAIDVVAMVNERNEKVIRGEVRDDVTGDVITTTVPIQNTDQRPNGGLTPASEADTLEATKVPVVESASSTATTSEVTVSETTEENTTETEEEITPVVEEAPASAEATSL